MEIPYAIIFMGGLIFFSHIMNGLFSYIKVPNVLLLLLIGVVIGPITGLVQSDVLGDFGPVFTTITLIVIMFESGVSLKFADIGKAFGPAMILTVVNFLATLLIAAFITTVFLGFSMLTGIFVGAIIGGTSSAVVVPMIKQLKLGEKGGTILFLESALSDVLCLVVGLALLQGMQAGVLEVGQVFSKMWKAFLIAALLGVAGGLVWSVILKLLRNMKNFMFTSLASVFILYGLVEYWGFNGGIAALCYGLILGNSKLINKQKWFQKLFNFETTALTKNEKNFFSEIVFILQTYFFVYVGLSIKFDKFFLYLLGLLIIAAIILVRPVPIRLLGKKSLKMRDVSIMSILTPKGLVTAVLASIPLQMGLENGAEIQGLGYAIVFLSITISSIMVILADKNPFFMERYNFVNLNLREMDQKEKEVAEQERLLKEQEELEKQEAKALYGEEKTDKKAEEGQNNEDEDDKKDKPKGYNEFEEE